MGKKRIKKKTRKEVSILKKSSTTPKKIRKGPISLHLRLKRPSVVRAGKRRIRSFKMRLPKPRSKKIPELSTNQAKRLQKQGLSAIQQAIQSFAQPLKSKSPSRKKKVQKSKKRKR
ncbi:hypothetical protein J4410_02980 [Candidatus Woesearchaeota archaeon]|nr:hypothetical protein [Candidatus Woesearchaeota archaeon]